MQAAIDQAAIPLEQTGEQGNAEMNNLMNQLNTQTAMQALSNLTPEQLQAIQSVSLFFSWLSNFILKDVFFTV